MILNKRKQLAKKFKQMNKRSKMYLIVLVATIGALLVKLRFLKASPTNSKWIALLITFKTLLNGYPLRYAKWIIAQSKGESGLYASTVSKQNNIFGLRCSSKRKKYYSECVNNYALYSNVYDCINDYFDLLRYNTFPTNIRTVGEFVEALKDKRYFEASTEQYLRMINSHLA